MNWPRCLAEHEKWLRAVILARTRERQAVDEVWQEVALAAAKPRLPLVGTNAVAHWLYRVAVIHSIRYRRQQVRTQQRLARFAASVTEFTRTNDDPAELVLREESRQLVQQALELLPGRDAEILLLKYHERWSYRQIAAVLDISETAVDARVFRARQRLRGKLADHFPEEALR